MNARTNKSKKYRPYLSIEEIEELHHAISDVLTSSNILEMDIERRRVITSAEYVLSSIIRDINYEVRTADYVTSNRVKNSDITSSALFSEEELNGVSTVKLNSTNKPPSDQDILDSLDDYGQEIVFLNEELKSGIINKELYDIKLAAFKLQYNRE